MLVVLGVDGGFGGRGGGVEVHLIGSVLYDT